MVCLSDLNKDEIKMLEIIGGLNPPIPGGITSETISAKPEEVKRMSGFDEPKFAVTLESLKEKGYVRAGTGYVSGLTKKGRNYLNSKK
jgi:hypothetical protein